MVDSPNVRDKLCWALQGQSQRNLFRATTPVTSGLIMGNHRPALLLSNRRVSSDVCHSRLEAVYSGILSQKFVPHTSILSSICTRMIHQRRFCSTENIDQNKYITILVDQILHEIHVCIKQFHSDRIDRISYIAVLKFIFISVGGYNDILIMGAY